MLKRLTPREQLEQVAVTFEPMVRQAFLEAIAVIKSDVQLRLVVERLERKDIAGAIEAMNVDQGAFSRLQMVVADAYNSGGIAASNGMRLRDPDGNRVVFRFGVRNPAAEAFLQEHSSTLVTRIVADQRDAIREALRGGLARGDNPRTTALNVVGRINRTTGRREGGIIGLTAQQERFIAAARDELLSGDENKLRHYLTRERRDRRFDGVVARAIAAGKPVSVENTNRMVGRYSDRLLQLRGELLARTETMIAINVAADHAMKQAIEAGKVDAGAVTKIWHSAGDGRVRHTHRLLNRKRVPVDGVFRSPSGALLRYPGDPKAPISEISGCRCWVERKIDFLAGIS